MRALPERQLEFLQLLKQQPRWITGPLHMRGINELLTYLVMDLGPSVTAVHFSLEEENQLAMVAKHVDAAAFEGLLHEGEKIFFHLMLIALCEAVTIRIDQFMLQAFQGECTYSVLEEPTRAELTTKFKLRKDVLGEYEMDFASLSYGAQQLAYLTPGLKVIIEQTYGERQRNVYCYPRGVLDYLDYKLDLMGSFYQYIFSRQYMEGEMGRHHYRIGICLGSVEKMRTFTNYRELKRGNLLEEGILKGLMRGIQEAASEEGMEVVIGKGLLLKRLYCIAVVVGEAFKFYEREAPDFVLDVPGLEEAVSRLVCEEVVGLEKGERLGILKLFKK